MITGRLAWGISKTILMGLRGKAFTASMFIAGGFVDAIPEIMLQLVLIPSIMLMLNKGGIFK